MKTTATLISALLLGATASAQEIGQQQKRENDLSRILRAGVEAFGGTRQQDTISLNQITANWNQTARAAAKAMFEKYGAPQEIAPDRLVWKDNRPWKRTEVFNEEVAHHFPVEHVDCLRQTLALDVDPEHYTDLARFDGSVTVDRTRGEIAATCDKEENNFIALNLAHDIISRRLSVEEARQRLAELAQASQQGQQSAYARGIEFELPVSTRTGDPDRRYEENRWQNEQRSPQQQQRRRIGW